MVVVSRNEINRARTGSILGLVLAAALLVGVVSLFSESSPFEQAVLLVLGLAAAGAAAIAAVNLLWHRGPSKAILFHQGDRMVVATNHLHDGFKLRFFRDVLGEHMVSFSDAERERWKSLEKEGFHPVFKAQNVRKTYLLSLCFMVFDHVFVFDHHGRWDYFDCRGTSEPTFSQRGVGPFSDDSVIPDSRRQPAT